MNRWASQPLRASADDFLAAVRFKVPVSLIAIPRAELKCERSSEWEKVEANPDLADFDQVPLTDETGGHIGGVFLRGTGRLELRENMFLAADASLLSFIESADLQRFRFLLTDSAISGMVTVSDLQKLPVYSVLFSLVIAVEMLLMEWIRARCGVEENAWLDHLTRSQRDFVEKCWKTAVKNNLAIDRLCCASFGQEMRAASGLGLFEGNEDMESKLKALVKLRNQVCHASEFAPNLAAALRIPCLVRDAHTLAAWLQDQIGRQAQ